MAAERPAEVEPELLRVRGLHAHYGRAHILSDLGFEVAPGEVLALVGRNGAGKSTCLKAVIGLVPPSSGTVEVAGTNVAGWPPHRIAAQGVGYVPEDRRIFAELTLLENLEVGRQPPRQGAPVWTADDLFEIFPNLRELRHRPAGQTSGGEQQMLAIARTLMGNPRIVLLDEPSEGLAPLIVGQMSQAIHELKLHGVAVLLSEQNLSFATAVADRALVIEKGRSRFAGTMAELVDNEAVGSAYLAP